MTDQEMIDYVRDSDLSELIRFGEPVELAPAMEGEVVAVRTVCLPALVYEELLRIAEIKGADTSALIRQIIEHWVKQYPAQ